MTGNIGDNVVDFTQDWNTPVFFDDFQLDEIPCACLVIEQPNYARG